LSNSTYLNEEIKVTDELKFKHLQNKKKIIEKQQLFIKNTYLILNAQVSI